MDSVSLVFYAKVAADRANRQPYRVDRQATTIVPFTIIALSNHNPCLTATLHSTCSVKNIGRQNGITSVFMHVSIMDKNL